MTKAQRELCLAAENNFGGRSGNCHDAVLYWLSETSLVSKEEYEKFIKLGTTEYENFLVSSQDKKGSLVDLKNLEGGMILGFYVHRLQDWVTLDHSMVTIGLAQAAGVNNHLTMLWLLEGLKGDELKDEKKIFPHKPGAFSKLDIANINWQNDLLAAQNRGGRSITIHYASPETVAGRIKKLL